MFSISERFVIFQANYDAPENYATVVMETSNGRERVLRDVAIISDVRDTIYFTRLQKTASGYKFEEIVYPKDNILHFSIEFTRGEDYFEEMHEQALQAQVTDVMEQLEEDGENLA